MQIKARQVVEVEIDKQDLAAILFREAWSLCQCPDDGGCDWYTDTKGNTYITDDLDWKVSSNPMVASLIDASHFLKSGAAFKISEPETADTR